MEDVRIATTRAAASSLEQRNGPRSSTDGDVLDVPARGEPIAPATVAVAQRGRRATSRERVPARGSRTVTEASEVGSVGDAGWNTFYGTP